MRKKFLGAFMLGLLALGTASTITSCKDYDGDISTLKNDVSTLQTEKAALETKVSDLQKEVATDESKLSALQDSLSNYVTIKEGDRMWNYVLNLEVKYLNTKDQVETNKQNIETLQGAITDINTLLAGKVDKSEFTEETQKIWTKIGEIETTLGTKVDQTAYDEAVKAIYAKIEAVETDLGKQLKEGIASLQKGLENEALARAAADKDLQDEIKLLALYGNELEKRVDTDSIRIDGNVKAIEELAGVVSSNKSDISTNKADIATNKTDIATLKKAVAALQSQMQDAIDDIAGCKSSIEDLTKKLQTLNDRVNDLGAQVNALNVLIKQELRSIVFDPEAYYWGIEATEAFALSYNVYTLEPASADKKEGTVHEKFYNTRFDSVAGSTALPVVAEYFMNPSSAQIADPNNQVSIISEDDKYVVARGAAAGINLAKAWTESGKLKVQLKFNDPAAIKSIPANQMVTVFATSVDVKNGTVDTTITSDFAAIYKTTAKDLQLAVINPVSQQPASCGDFDCKPVHSHPHMYATEQEAADAAAQYQVAYNSTIDLAQYVETHYSNGTEYSKLDVEDYGLEYKYELVGYFIGTNKTSESAHAAMQGSVLRPQEPVWSDDAHKEGTAGAWGRDQKELSIGRTPIVRVSLIDTNNNNRVVQYGYIKLEITDTTPGEDPTKDVNVVPFEFNGYTFNYECTPASFSDKLTWAQMESYIYDLYGMSRTDFDANYTKDLNSSSEFKQYIYDSKNKKFVELTNYIGVISPVINMGADATDVAQWEISAADMKTLLTNNDKEALFKDAPYKTGDKIEVYFRYASNDTKKYGDIYVKLSTGALTINKPSAVGLTDNNKIAENWYTTNSSVAKSGYDEVHAQTLSPEDPYAKAIAEVLDYNIYNVFVGNKITIAESTDNTSLKEFTEGNSLFTKSVIFSDDNKDKVYTGILDGAYVQYKLSVSSDNKELQVVAWKNPTDTKWTTQTPVTIAIINGDAVKFQHTTEGEAMLNYKAHNALADDVLTAIMQVKAASECFSLPLEKDTWNVRFLRPINVESQDTSVTDAKDQAQIVKLVDLVKFTDWREIWKETAANKYTSYYSYYNIQSIEVVGASAGDNIASYVTANLNQADKDTYVKLSTITNNIRLTYDPKTVTSGQKKSSDYGTITYENHGNTVADFDVKIPVVVTYEWGKVYATVKLHVNGTIGDNSAKRK